MQQEELSAMKYGDLFKLAREKLNITRRVSKDKLIEMLLKLHHSALSDSNFVSADESTGNSTMDTEVPDEPVQKRGRKRGNQHCDGKKSAVANKKAKKSKKETVEHTLNSTFSVDEDEDMNDKTINVDLPVVTSKPTKLRKLRGRKENAYLTEESSANESEPEKIPASLAKKSKKSDLNEKPSTNDRTPVVRLRRLDISGLSEDNSTNVSSPEKSVVNEESVKVQPPAKETEPQPLNRKIAPKKLKKSNSAVSVEKSPANEPEMEKMPVRKTRSSGQTEIPAAENQTSADQQQKEVPTEKLKEPVSSAASPQAEPCLQSPVVVEKMPLRRTSTHPLRSRKPTVKTPAKTTTMTPMASAKKGVQFTAKNDATDIPKPTKPKAAPNFAQIHQKNFMKFQSVDEYVERKRARTETMTSAKSIRTKSVLTNVVTPQAKPAVIVKAKVITPDPVTTKNMKFNFVSGLQKPVFTAKGQVVNEKQRVMATVKDNLHNVSQGSAVTTRTTAAAKGKRKASMLNVSSRDVNVSKLSLAGKQILKGVRTNRRFDLQMQHRNMKN